MQHVSQYWDTMSCCLGIKLGQLQKLFSLTFFLILKSFWDKGVWVGFLRSNFLFKPQTLRFWYWQRMKKLNFYIVIAYRLQLKFIYRSWSQLKIMQHVYRFEKSLPIPISFEYRYRIHFNTDTHSKLKVPLCRNVTNTQIAASLNSPSTGNVTWPAARR